MKRVKKWLALMLAASMVLPSGMTAKAESTVDANLSVEARYSSNHIRWSDVEGATAYRVLRSDAADGTFTAVTTSDISDVNGTTNYDYVDATAGRGTQYYYKVEVVNSDSTTGVTVAVRDTYETGVTAVQQHAAAEQLHIDFSTVEGGRNFNGSRVYTVDSELVNKVKDLVNGSILISFKSDNTVTRQETLFVAKDSAADFNDTTGLVILRNSNSRVRMETKGGLKFDDDQQNINANAWSSVIFKLNEGKGALVLDDSAEKSYTKDAYKGLFSFSGSAVNSMTIGAQKKDSNIVSNTSFTGQIAYVTITDEILSVTERQAYNLAVSELCRGSVARKALESKIQEVTTSGNRVKDEADFNAKVEAAQTVLNNENSTDAQCQEQLDILNAITYVDYRISDEILADKASANSYDNSGNDGGAAWAFEDGNRLWHQNYGHGSGTTNKASDTNPIYIQTGFGEAKYVSRLIYRPRKDAGDINKYTISIANLSDPDGTPADSDWTVVKTGNLAEDTSVNTAEQDIILDKPVRATHIRLTAYSVHGNNYVVAQRIKIWEKDAKEVLKEYIDLVDAIEEKTDADITALATANTVYSNAGATQAEINAQIDALADLIYVRKVTLNKTQATIKGEGTVALSATVTPACVEDTSVTWTSLHPDVATVNANGVVTAVSAGTAVIRATSVANEEVYAECVVTVAEKTAYFAVADRTSFDGTSGITLDDEAVAFVQDVVGSTITVKFKTEKGATGRQDLLTLADDNNNYFSIFVEGNKIGYDNRKARPDDMQETPSLNKNSHHGIDLNDGQWHTVTVLIIDAGKTTDSMYTFYVDDKRSTGWKWSYNSNPTNGKYRYPALTGEGFVPTSVIVGAGVDGANKFTGAMKLAKIYNYALTDQEVKQFHGTVTDNTEKTVEVTSRTLTSDKSIVPITGGGNFTYGETATLVATAAKGYQFVGWFYKDDIEAGDTSSVLSTDMTYSFVVKANATGADSYVALYEANGSVDLTITNAENVKVNDVTYTDVVSIPADTEVTVSYTGSNFLYWQNASGKVVSTNAIHTFTLVNNTTLTPVVKSATTGSALVEFVNEYNQVLSVSTWDKAGSDALSATTPSKLGYDFKGWALEAAPTTVVDAAAVRTAITGGATYVRLVPVYAKVATNHTVTYKNNSEGATNKTATVELGATCTVNANDVAVDGQKFSHWAIGNEIVSYNTSYTFLVTGNVTLTAVFVAENETVAKASILEITSQYEIKNGETVAKVAFVASREIAEGYTLLEHGMLYARNSEITDTNAFVEGADGVNKFTANGTGAKGALTLNVRLGEATSIKVRAYAIVKNDTTGEVTTLYSDMATYPAQQ